MIEILKAVKYIINKAENRVKPKREYDQFYATEITLIKRIKLLSKFKFEKIIFLGDDDLNSLCLGYYKKLKKEKAEIFVLDIDKDQIDFIEKISEEENLEIKTIYQDIRDALPKDLKNFDLAFFDPPYTPNAVKIWLIRALEILLGSGTNKERKDYNFLKNKYIFMCYGYTDKSLERGLKIQKIISDLGLIVQAKYRKFNKYTGAESINNESDLYIIQPTPKVNLKEIDYWKNKKIEEKIYTYEV